MAKSLDSILKTLNGSPSAPKPPAPSGGMDPMLLAAMGMGGGDQAQPQPQEQAQSPLADIYSPQVAAPQAPPPMPDNPYTPADNNAPAEIANSIGTPDKPIDVVGDSWKPHKESTLGRIMDTFLQMDGHAPVFQQRTDDRNLKDAMKGTDKDQQLLFDRVKQFNPKLAMDIQQDLTTRNANQALEEQRKQARQDTGRSNLSNMLTSIEKSSDPGSVYARQLPMLRKYADSYGLSSDELPEQYDADAIHTYRNQGTSAYQQDSLAQNADEHKDLQAERQSDVNLRKTQLGIENYNAQTSRMNAETSRDSLTNRSDNMDAGTLSQRQSLYKQMLGGASKVPWLYGGFVKGVFGGGSKGIPVPGKVYVSPDKTMAVKLNGNGSWSVYDLSKGMNHAREIQRLGGVVGGTDGEDFSN